VTGGDRQVSSLEWNNGVTISLADTVSVVIGASEGIGAAIALGLARAGSRVVAGGRDPVRMAETVAAAEQAGHAIHVETVDVRRPESVAAFAGAVTGRHGAPTILVNSMGGSLVKEIADVEVAEWDDLHHTHLRGTFLVCQAFAPAMAARGYGKIINLSSLAGFRVTPRRGVYAVAKAGLNHLTRALAAEWGAQGIRVNCIAPTTTRTPRASANMLKDPDREARIVARTPLGRIAEPEDMVGPALFLASRLSDFVTGQTIAVDGGQLAGG